MRYSLKRSETNRFTYPKSFVLAAGASCSKLGMVIFDIFTHGSSYSYIKRIEFEVIVPSHFQNSSTPRIWDFFLRVGEKSRRRLLLGRYGTVTREKMVLLRQQN